MCDIASFKMEIDQGEEKESCEIGDPLVYELRFAWMLAC